MYMCYLYLLYKKEFGIFCFNINYNVMTVAVTFMYSYNVANNNYLPTAFPLFGCRFFIKIPNSFTGENSKLKILRKIPF